MASDHFDEQGQAIMVDISSKVPNLRIAKAQALVRMRPETLQAIMAGGNSKGDILAVARLAGIAAAKRTPELIPLAHPLAIQHAKIDFITDAENGEIKVIAVVKAVERTGMEMEAMVAAAVAALTIYDMCKGGEKGITIQQVALLAKEGGKSGPWSRE